MRQKKTSPSRKGGFFSRFFWKRIARAPSVKENERNASSKAKRISPQKKPHSGNVHGSYPGKKRSVLGTCLIWGGVALIWFCVLLVGVIVYHGAQLPAASSWKVPDRPPDIKILSEEGQYLASRGEMGGQNISLEAVSPFLPKAVVAIEDHRFYTHFGLDPIAVLRAIWRNLQQGRLAEGGSTLTQQLAKNLFFKPERTFARKIQELILAFWLEATLTKEEILELYLNRVYMGAGVYGVEAAAHRYFGKSARDVSLSESAILAALLKAPSFYAPHLHPGRAQNRAKLVLAAMEREGFITTREHAFALSHPAKPRAKDPRNTEEEYGTGYAVDWVIEQLPELIGTPRKDIVVRTSLSLDLQKKAQAALHSVLKEIPKLSRNQQVALVTLDLTGAIKAMIGGRSYAETPYNRAVFAKRQPGSAFKPFVYLAALESGLTPQSLRTDRPLRLKGWQPENADGTYYGRVTLQQALALSRNTVAAQLIAELGSERVIETARRLGIHSPLVPNLSLALGTSEVTLLELSAAYVPFSNGGFRVRPFLIQSIYSTDGTVLYKHQGASSPERPVITPQSLQQINAMLLTALESGTGKRAALPGWQAGGKTGTSQRSRDAWLIGFTAYLTTGVWFGSDTGDPIQQMSGGGAPALLWHRFMRSAHTKFRSAPLPGQAPRPSEEEVLRVNSSLGSSPSPRPIGETEQGDVARPPASPRTGLGGFIKRLLGRD